MVHEDVKAEDNKETLNTSRRLRDAESTNGSKTTNCQVPCIQVSNQ